MAPIRQTSFAAGELSPYLWGRTDLELHGAGLRTLRNFFVTRQGAARSRGGTKYISTAASLQVRLIPFVYSDSISYVLELGQAGTVLSGNGYLRIHTSAGYTGIELVTPWNREELQAIQFAQVGDVLMLAHPNHALRELRAPNADVGGTGWSLLEARFEPPPDLPTETQSLVARFRAETRRPAPRIGEPAGDNFYRMVPMLVQFPSGYAGVDPRKIEAPADSLFVTDIAHPAKEWRYKVSALMRHKVTGQEVETLPLDVTEWFDGFLQSAVKPITDTAPDNFIVCYPDSPVLLRFPNFGSADLGALGVLLGLTPNSVLGEANNWLPVGVVYYRGRGKLFGFVGTTDSAKDFIDDGIEPDYARQPLRGDVPSIGTNPAAVAFFQGRRVLALRQTICASATDEWANHDLVLPPFVSDDSAIEFDLYATKRESIRCLVPGQRLLVLTDSSAWSVGGTAGSGLAPANIEARLEDQVGAEALMPLVVDGSVLYARAKGRGLRALFANGDSGFKASDITWQAEHLFVGGGGPATSGLTRRVAQMAYQEDPWGTVWVVREDGMLLSGTHTSENVWAWARHDTAEGAAYEESTPEYRLESGLFDSGSASGSFVGDKFVSVCSVPESTEDAVYVAVRRRGLVYIERMDARSQSTDDPSFDFACVDSHVRYIGPVPTNIPGLGHLIGREVWLTAAGNRPQGPLAVKGDGSVDIPEPLIANRSGTDNCCAFVGLKFTCDLELLDLSGRGATKQKHVTEVGLEVDSAVGLSAGPNLSNLTPWKQRRVSDGYGYPSAASELVVVKVGGGWSRAGRAALRQELPLPVTVLGVTREVESGEGS